MSYLPLKHCKFAIDMKIDENHKGQHLYVTIKHCAMGDNILLHFPSICFGKRKAPHNIAIHVPTPPHFGQINSRTAS